MHLYRREVLHTLWQLFDLGVIVVAALVASIASLKRMHFAIEQTLADILDYWRASAPAA